MLEHESVLHPFIWPNNISLCGYTTFYLSIHHLMGIWVVSTFRLLWIMLQRTFVYKFFFFLLELFFTIRVFPPQTLNFFQIYIDQTTCLRTFLLRSILWWKRSVPTGGSYLNLCLFSWTLHLLPRKINQIPKNSSWVKGKKLFMLIRKKLFMFLSYFSYDVKFHKVRWAA